jgi:hypothetical protein
MRFKVLLAIASLTAAAASASTIQLTFNQDLDSLHAFLDTGGIVWTAQFDLATHPTSPFTTPDSITGPFTVLNVPIINWSGDNIVSIVDASVHDTSTTYSWDVDQGPAGGHVLSQGLFQCHQPCADHITDPQNYGLVSPNYGFRQVTGLDSWRGVGVASTSPVPEPGNVLLIAFAALALIGSRYWIGRREGTKPQPARS